MRYLVTALLLTTAYGQFWSDETERPTKPVVYGDSYIVGVPLCVRPGLSADVYVDIVKRVNPVNVTVELLKKSRDEVLVSSHPRAVQPGKPEIISLPVPRDWREVTEFYRIRVTGRSPQINFVNMTSVKVVNENVTGFLQTDKAVYKPGQRVTYRVFSLYPDLKINKGVYKIEIRDPKRNKIRTEEGVNDPTGLIRGYLDLSDEPIYGTWTIYAFTTDSYIDVKDQDTFNKEVGYDVWGTTFRKSFEVQKYELNRIEVAVTPPSFVTVEQPTVDVTITAKYTLGEDARGSLLVTGKCFNWFSRYKNETQPGLKQRIENFQGTATVTFVTADILGFQEINCRSNRFSFEANLTEILTGAVNRGEESTRFYDMAEKVEYASSNPSRFKPALTFTAYAKVSQQDGSPIKPQSEKLKVAVQMSYYSNISQPVEENKVKNTEYSLSYWKNRYKTINLTSMELDVPADGLVNIHIPFIPREAEQITIISTYKGHQASWFARRAFSPSNSFIQLVVHRELRKPYEKQKITLKSNVPIDSFSFLVTSRGRIVMTREETRNAATQHGISFKITHDMAPRARVVAYYRTASGEIVPDVISFNVLDPFKNKVSISFDAEEVRPGGDVSMRVKADPGSMVATLLLDKSGYDITDEEVTNSLSRFDSCWNDYFVRDTNELRRRRKRSFIPWRYPYFSSGKDSDSVFNEADLNILTDSLLYFHKYNFYRDDYELSDPPYTEFGPIVDVDARDQLQQVQTSFSETWLFLVSFTDENGEVTIPASAPDNITTWHATAFAFNDQSGFGITSVPAKLTVGKEFFINLYLPYSVILGEKVLIQVKVFNYFPAEQIVEVELNGSDSYLSLDIDDAGSEISVSGPRKQTIKVPSGMPRSVVFPIRVTELGEISLTATAHSAAAVDSSTHTFVVKT